MIDFDKLVKDGGSFVGTSPDWESYKEWVAKASCVHCGAKQSDRQRDDNGRVISGSWLRETDCGCKWRINSI